MKHSVFSLRTICIATALLGGVEVPLSWSQVPQRVAPSSTAASRQVDERGGHGGRLEAIKQSPSIGSQLTKRPVLAMRTTASTCLNLLPNPSFEDQKVANLSGNVFNISGPSANYDELAAWRSTNGSSPDYYATNAPTGTKSNPISATSWGAFTPYDRNGAVGLYVSVAQFSSNDQEYITPSTGPLTMSGAYYASFRAYRAPNSGDATKLGMNFTTTNPLTTTYEAVFPRATGTSIESAGFLQTATWERISGKFTVASGQYYANIGNLSPTEHAASGVAYYYVDDVQLYKIPTAGPEKSCTRGGSVIGEGCEIPGATYAWSPAAGLNSTNALNVKALPVVTTVYTLTVTLPDGTTHVTNTTVNACASCPIPATPPVPVVELQAPNPCADHQLSYTIANYNPDYSYTITVVSGRASALPGVIAIGQGGLSYYPFRIKTGVPSATEATFIVTAINTCEANGAKASSSTEEYADFSYCTSPRPAPSATAYPNPATDMLTVPQNATKATLLNSQGKVVLRSDATGHLDVRNLPAGLYNLQTQQEGKVVNQRIEVKH